MNYSRLAYIFTFFLISIGCNQATVFENNTDIAQQKWDYAQKATFEVPITDTTQQYNLYLNLRHTETYPYKNLWLMMHTTFPNGKNQSRRVEIPLADSQGKWFGKGSSIISQQIQIQSNAIFPQIGKYQFAIEQNMRVNPLPDILSVGIKIEKANDTKPPSTTQP